MTNRVRDPGTIGKFGFGLKHGTMRLGDDALVLTKSSTTFSVGLLSQTYNAHQPTAKAPIITRLKAGYVLDLSVNNAAETAEAEEIIKEFSVFNHFTLAQQLAEMPEVGTRIIIFNLRKCETEENGTKKKKEDSDSDEDEDDLTLKAKKKAHKLKLQQLHDAKRNAEAASSRASNGAAAAAAAAGGAGVGSGAGAGAAAASAAALKGDEAYELKFASVAGDIQLVIDPLANYRERSNQMTTDVPCDYSLRAYLAMLFLDAPMQITIQDVPVTHLDWSHFLTQTKEYECTTLSRFKGAKLLLGYSEVEKQRGNAGFMLYWHNTLIESYRRVGIQTGNTDAGLGVIGVFNIGDVHEIDPNNNKQGFPQSNKHFMRLLKWLGSQLESYWHHVLCKDLIPTERKEIERLREAGLIEAEGTMAQCDKVRKRRILTPAHSQTCTHPASPFFVLPLFFLIALISSFKDAWLLYSRILFTGDAWRYFTTLSDQHTCTSSLPLPPPLCTVRPLTAVLAFCC